MKWLDQRGVAPITVVVIVLVSIGGTIGVPVAVDVADVDPDHPLYALERFGERIRMVDDEAQMKERCIEGYRMFEKYGEAALRYDVFKEFVEKAEVLMAKPEVKEKVKAWLEGEEQRAGIVTDLYDVDPDHPLYEYEKKGELFRKITDEDLLKERWDEYARLVDWGKGLEYEEILDNFVEKVRACVPGDNPAKPEVVQWMQEHIPSIGRVRLKLCKEMLEKCKEELPELEENILAELEAIENYEKLPTISSELLEEIMARLKLIEEKVKEKIPEELAPYLEILDIIGDVNITANVEINISIEVPPDLAAEYNEMLTEFEIELVEIEAELEGAEIELEIPGEFKTLQKTHGLYAVKRLVEVAKDLREKAQAAFDEGEYRKALGLIHAAKMNLKQAEKILEHAVEWEKEYREIWEKHRERFEEFKEELKEELGKEWAKIVEEYKGKLEELKQKMKERLEKWKKA